MATVGRYKDIGRASTPGELPREGEVRGNAHAQIRHGAVADPNPSLRGKRQKAAINTRTDALEREYANGRVSEAGYLAGRLYGRVLQRSRRPITGAGAWSAGDKVDYVDSHEDAIAKRMDAADKAVAMVRDTAPVLGLMGQRVLELALVDELTLRAIAGRIRGGRAGQNDAIYVAQLFRESLEVLADHWSKRRNRPPR